MKSKYIILGISFLILIVAAVVVYDLVSNKPENLPENPYEYNVEGYALVPDSMISHRESKQISIRNGKAKDLDYANGKIFLLIDSMLQIVSSEGKELSRYDLNQNPMCLKVTNEHQILIGFERQIKLYSLDGKLLKSSISFPDKSIFKAVAATKNRIFVADAGEKVVRIFDNDLKEISSFKGESGVSDQHGFIIPSLHFDLGVNNENELWVVNPGLHAIQNYTEQGKLRGFWSKTSFESIGFSGCCNPFYIAFLSDGSFVTSEKGLVRIKIHKSSGELASVVAPPDLFTNGHKAPAIAVDENDKILALDFDRKMIRIFTPKNK